MTTTTNQDLERAVVELNERFKDTDEIIRWAIERFGDDLTLACSLGVEDMVLVEHLVRNAKDLGKAVPPIFVLDTGRLHQQTYDVLDEARIKYGIEFEIYFPDKDRVQELVRTRGVNSFYQSVENRKECCGVRKVEPLGRALSGKQAWITGLRRAQAVTRSDVAMVEVDDGHGNIFKLNPLADWSEEQVWDYVKEKKIPTNVLHKQGYPSIGCAPCTRAIHEGEDIRAGRWWWENPDMKECGLHVATPLPSAAD